MPDISLTEIEKGLKDNKSQQTYEQIVNEFFNGKNLEFKTEIRDVLAMTMLDTVGEWIEDEFGKENAKFLKVITRWYRTNAVPHNRESRKEVIRALTAYSNSQQSNDDQKLMNRLMGR